MEVNIIGENTTDFTFRDDEDWKKILRFINADPNADFEYYHCSRKQDAFRYDCYVDIEERLLQIRINQTEADDKKSNSQWVICPTSHFMGLGWEP